MESASAGCDRKPSREQTSGISKVKIKTPPRTPSADETHEVSVGYDVGGACAGHGTPASEVIRPPPLYFLLDGAHVQHRRELEEMFVNKLAQARQENDSLRSELTSLQTKMEGSDQPPPPDRAMGDEGKAPSGTQGPDMSPTEQFMDVAARLGAESSVLRDLVERLGESRVKMAATAGEIRTKRDELKRQMGINAKTAQDRAVAVACWAEKTVVLLRQQLAATKAEVVKLSKQKDETEANGAAQSSKKRHASSMTEELAWLDEPEPRSDKSKESRSAKGDGWSPLELGEEDDDGAHAEGAAEELDATDDIKLRQKQVDDRVKSMNTRARNMYRKVLKADAELVEAKASARLLEEEVQDLTKRLGVMEKRLSESMAAEVEAVVRVTEAETASAALKLLLDARMKDMVDLRKRLNDNTSSNSKSSNSTNNSHTANAQSGVQQNVRGGRPVDVSSAPPPQPPLPPPPPDAAQDEDILSVMGRG